MTAMSRPTSAVKTTSDITRGFTALAGNSCDSYTSLQQRNNNNKIDPCLDWSANMNDKVATYGLTFGKKTEKKAA